MNHELKMFFVKLSVLLIITPLLGFGLLRFVEYFEKVWKKGNARKKWLMMCLLSFMLAVAGGFLR